MRVTVDSEICQGHTLCNMAAPELFKLRDDDGHAYVTDDGVIPADSKSRARARQAAATCPEMAIEIDE
jgi:ferredoxin